RYLPGAPGPEKMKNTPGYGGRHLYQPNHTKFDRIVICAGEMKALVTSQLLYDRGWGAVSVTAGEDAWDVKLNEYFKGKQVYLLYDIDAGGERGAKKVAG